MIFLIAVSLICLFIITGLFLLLSHGKVKIRFLLMRIIHSFSISLPLIIFCYYRFQQDKGTGFPIYIILSGLLILPSLIMIWYNVMRRREPILINLALTSGLIFIVFSPLFPIELFFIINICGIFLISIFFIHHFKYPYLDDSWLFSLIEETAHKIDKTGRYSYKPVVIHKAFGKRMVSKNIGLTLYFKPDKVICRISKKLHKKLGEPPLEFFFKTLIDRIDSLEMRKRHEENRKY